MDGPIRMDLNGTMPNQNNNSAPPPPEPPSSGRVPDYDRIRKARIRRQIQLKQWEQYDRKMTREVDHKNPSKVISPYGERGFFQTGHGVRFPQSLIFLDAAARGDLDEVRNLLSAGVCPNVANEDGLTALHQGCIDNTPEMCRLLLRYGADPDARDTELWTPLHAAATCHHTELCAILIEHGADLLAMNADGNMPYECCMPGPTSNLIENEMNRKGITQEQLDDLHRQPEVSMLTDMEKLFKSGGDLNALDKQGASMLHISSACGFEEVVRFLLKYGARIDLLDRDGWQAIHIAACWDHFDIIKLLIDSGANIMAETTSGETVFDICEDLETHSCLTELKHEMELKRTEQQLQPPEFTDKSRDLVKRRGSTNTRSASIRRTSMKEKKLLSLQEPKQEAQMLGVNPTAPETMNTDDQVFGETEKPTEIHIDRRVTSPLTVNASPSNGNPKSQQPLPVIHGSLKRSSLTDSPAASPTWPDGVIISPKPKRPSTERGSISPLPPPPPPPPPATTNGQIRSPNGTLSPNPARPSSRNHDANRIDKPVVLPRASEIHNRTSSLTDKGPRDSTLRTSTKRTPSQDKLITIRKKPGSVRNRDAQSNDTPRTINGSEELITNVEITLPPVQDRPSNLDGSKRKPRRVKPSEPPVIVLPPRSGARTNRPVIRNPDGVANKNDKQVPVRDSRWHSKGSRASDPNLARHSSERNRDGEEDGRPGDNKPFKRNYSLPNPRRKRLEPARISEPPTPRPGNDQVGKYIQQPRGTISPSQPQEPNIDRQPANRVDTSQAPSVRAKRKLFQRPDRQIRPNEPPGTKNRWCCTS